MNLNLHPHILNLCIGSRFRAGAGVVAALAGSFDTYAKCLARGDIVHPVTAVSNNQR